MGIHDNIIAIVTGGEQVIGRGIVDVLSSEGAKVCVADISKEHGESTVNQINENGGYAILKNKKIILAMDIGSNPNKNLFWYISNTLKKSTIISIKYNVI